MVVAFTNLSWWLWSGKHQDPKTSKKSSLSPSSGMSLRESDAVKYPLSNGGKVRSSSRNNKWKSRKHDSEYDVVLVPSDGGCVSGSESDDSDWSVGWLEPHGPEFNDRSDDSFAVLVPCYGYGNLNTDNNLNKFQITIGVVPDDVYASERNKYLKQWISAVKS